MVDFYYLQIRLQQPLHCFLPNLAAENMAFKVLVIDDEKLSRSYIRNMLQEYDITLQVGEAGSAEEAIRQFAETPPDILFLDIKMPDVDGFALLKMLPGRDFELVFVTAYDQYAIKAIKEGAADYLLKPIKKTDFKEMLATVTARRQNTMAMRGKLNDVENKLQSYIANIKEQNVLIEQLQEELDSLQHRNTPNAEKADLLDQLQKKAILTDDDWTHFKEIFDTVHPAFFVILRAQHPSLTQAEVRLMALTRLNMTTKEMAAMLGISPETVRQTRWRVRKKMNLSDDVSLDDIVLAI